MIIFIFVSYCVEPRSTDIPGTSSFRWHSWCLCLVSSYREKLWRHSSRSKTRSPRQGVGEHKRYNPKSMYWLSSDSDCGIRRIFYPAWRLPTGWWHADPCWKVCFPCIRDGQHICLRFLGDGYRCSHVLRFSNLQHKDPQTPFDLCLCIHGDFSHMLGCCLRSCWVFGVGFSCS